MMLRTLMDSSMQRAGEGETIDSHPRPETDAGRKRLCNLRKTNHTSPMKLQLDDVAMFTRIAELGTLSAAARERNCPVSQITRSLSRLESACGARLIHRSTHGLSLTEEGQTMLAYGRRVLDATAELGSELGGRISGPSGWVRVSVSFVIAETVIAPSLDGLYRRYPNLHIELRVDDRLADLARDGIDIAVRAGGLASETLVARRIGGFGRTVVASPAYLKRFGTPRKVAELDAHHLIGYTANPDMNRWPLRSSCDDAAYHVRPSTRSDNVALILTLARAGVGVGRLMDLLAAPLIRRGELVPLLQDEIDSQDVPIHALMLQERHRLPKIRACIDYWARWLRKVSATSTVVSKTLIVGTPSPVAERPSESGKVKRLKRQQNPS
jgi:DNA-binding transcriptional LysR family regulator